jgi:hypothetical protein
MVLVSHCMIPIVALRHGLPVIANHATCERSNTSTCPDPPVVDGLGRWPILDDCEKTHVVGLVFR